LLVPALDLLGFETFPPKGAYYVMTDFGKLSQEDDVRFAMWLCNEIGVATVPGSSFYSDPTLGRTQTRFTFCKRDETLRLAIELMQSLVR
jgi:aminotransferase